MKLQNYHSATIKCTKNVNSTIAAQLWRPGRCHLLAGRPNGTHITTTLVLWGIGIHFFVDFSSLSIRYGWDHKSLDMDLLPTSPLVTWAQLWMHCMMRCNVIWIWKTTTTMMTMIVSDKCIHFCCNGRNYNNNNNIGWVLCYLPESSPSFL